MQAVQTIASEQTRSGNVEAFRELVDEHSRQVFRLAFRMTGNRHDAEDVVQETFLRAYRQLDRFESPTHAVSWLHRIASNYAIDLLRRRKRWRSSDLDTHEEHAPLQSELPDPGREAISSEVSQRIREELERLTPKERIAFTLRHYEGLSIQEISDVMGSGISATKNHVFRAVHKLRRALKPWVGEA